MRLSPEAHFGSFLRDRDISFYYTVKRLNYFRINPLVYPTALLVSMERTAMFRKCIKILALNYPCLILRYLYELHSPLCIRVRRSCDSSWWRFNLNSRALTKESCWPLVRMAVFTRPSIVAARSRAARSSSY